MPAGQMISPDPEVPPTVSVASRVSQLTAGRQRAAAILDSGNGDVKREVSGYWEVSVSW